MIDFATSCRAIAEYPHPTRFVIARSSVRSVDVATGKIVAEVSLHKPHTGQLEALRDRMARFLIDNDMVDIHAVEGQDVDAPLAADAIDWSKL